MDGYGGLKVPRRVLLGPLARQGLRRSCGGNCGERCGGRGTSRRPARSSGASFSVLKRSLERPETWWKSPQISYFEWISGPKDGPVGLVGWYFLPLTSWLTASSGASGWVMPGSPGFLRLFVGSFWFRPVFFYLFLHLRRLFDACSPHIFVLGRVRWGVTVLRSQRSSLRSGSLESQASV